MFSYWDAFMWGILVGGLTVALAKCLETWFHNKFILDQKKLDTLLGEALIKMKKELDK